MKEGHGPTKLLQYLNLGCMVECTPIKYDCSSMKSSSFALSGRSTTPIQAKPTKFLGQILGKDSKSTRSAAYSKIKAQTLSNINSMPICGEYKTWILKNYIASSLFFTLAVDIHSTSAIQGLATKRLKKWLHLPRSTTLPVLFHPLVMNIPIYQTRQSSTVTAIICHYVF